MEAATVAVWGDILSDVRKEVGETRFNLWFKNTIAIRVSEGALTIGVPSGFMAEWLESHYQTLLAKLASARLGARTAVKVVVDGELFRAKRREESRAKEELLEEAAPREKLGVEARRFTLDNFVVGPCNSVAYAAALKVVEAPGEVYNPLFIHGGVGLGKTHLLVAIANALRGKGRASAAEYVSAEGFTNRFLFALRNGTLDAFRAGYRRAKTLIIDDVHFLASKPATQDEFLSTFNSLSREGCQIVMASDSHPKLIGKLKETLVTRFLSGMVAKLEKPGYATRREIFSRKAADRNLRLADEVADFVAKRIKGSIREIEGAVNTLAAYATLAKSPIDMATAAEALKGLIEGGSRPVRLPEVEAVVTAYSGLSEGDLRSARRTRPVSQARHLAMYLARSLGGFSYEEIGNHFGGRNHSSVVSAVEKVAGQVNEDAQFAREVAALKAEFGL